MRYAVEEMYLCDENVEKVLEGAREDMAAVFGYAADSQKVGITGTVDLVEIEGPIVIIRLGGRFWHKRSDVVQRVANYIIERIPEICDVEVEDAAAVEEDPPHNAPPHIVFYALTANSLHVFLCLCETCHGHVILVRTLNETQFCSAAVHDSALYSDS